MVTLCVCVCMCVCVCVCVFVCVCFAFNKAVAHVLGHMTDILTKGLHDRFR